MRGRYLERGKGEKKKQTNKKSNNKKPNQTQPQQNTKQAQHIKGKTAKNGQHTVLQYLPSPTSKSLKASSDPESSSRISPFKVNIIVCSFMSTIHPTTSPANHERPKCSLPWCHRCAWKGFRRISKSNSDGVCVPLSHTGTTKN